MLTESDRIALDRRQFQHEIAQELKRIESLPIEFSAITDGERLAEEILDTLHTQWKFATVDERPRLEAEICRHENTLAKCAAETAARVRDQLDLRDLAITTDPLTPHTI